MHHIAPRRTLAVLWIIAGILAVTVAWWAAALWPLPSETPEWVARARAACFGSTESGMPNSGGWILLIGQPLAMLGAVYVIWREEAFRGLGMLAASARGRTLLFGSAAVLLLLAGAAYQRVATAYASQAAGWELADVSPRLPDRLDSEPSPLSLADQDGGIVTLDGYRGRPVLVTFAYGKCATVCPVIVQSVLSARAEVADADPAIVIVTVDPWRDTPSRLPHIAGSWGLTGDAHLLGGAVDEVEATLDAWGVSRSRDLSTGEIAHPSLVYVIDPAGRLAYAVTGNEAQIVRALRAAAAAVAG
jgi:cytochrome oxidase Cu insertion factor (SCO1/SenC/PrrC family)